MNEWNIYRTRYLVRARQLSDEITITDPVGRIQHGHAGDYLVQSADGACRIAPRQVFEDIYVEIEAPPSGLLFDLAASLKIA